MRPPPDPVALADPVALPDPRVRPSSGHVEPALARLHALAAAALDAPTGQEATKASAALSELLTEALETDPAAVQRALDESPAPEIARRLWRELDHCLALAGSEGDGLVVQPFALPIVIVAGIESAAGDATLPGLLRDPVAVTAILREGGALAANASSAVSAALVRADVLGIAAWRDWQALGRLPEHAQASRNAFLVPAPVRIAPGPESVHLRFVVGTALCAPGVDLFRISNIERWGTKLTRELARELAAPGASVLPLARAPARPLPAAYAGFSAQREVSAQLFATNALRRFRASVGEAIAVLSAHRVPDARGGGELRVSLSSPLAPRDAEGFRCPLDPIEPVGPVATMLVELLRDCRVGDVRVASGIHPDRTADGAMRLFLRP